MNLAVSPSRNGLVVVPLAMSTLVADGYDLIVYRLDECRYLLIVNAANRETDFEWIRDHELRGSFGDVSA